MRIYDEIASSVLKALYNMPPTTGYFVENFRCDHSFQFSISDVHTSYSYACKLLHHCEVMGMLCVSQHHSWSSIVSTRC